MRDENGDSEPPRPDQGLWRTAKQTGLVILIGSVLLIPRVRRLRRRAEAWAFIRLASVFAGAWLLWWYRHEGARIPSLVAGTLLLLFAVFVRARPTVKSTDDWARELNALTVLNGGTFRMAGEQPARGAEIFVRPDIIMVFAPPHRILADIPVPAIRAIAAHPLANNGGDSASPWEVVVEYAGDVSRRITFSYDGPFAEHLARVTESTLREQRKKGLPILP